MSANNFLLIKEYEEIPRYRIFEGDADAGVDTDSKPIDHANTLEDAMDKCERFENENIVEYGIIFRGLGK